MTTAEQPTVFGRYQLLKVAGTGGMAQVHLARQVGPQNFVKPCVVKRISAEFATNQEVRHMFLEEARVSDLTNMVGFNYRMTELSAAIGLVQLAAVEEHVACRQHLAERLSEGLSGLPGVTVPSVRAGCRHVYYLWGPRYDAALAGPSRNTFVQALRAEEGS